MTEEDQMLVTHAALHGCRFVRISMNGHRGMWSYLGAPGNLSKWTIGRAADFYLWTHKMRSDAEHDNYDGRTDHYREAQDLDQEFMASVLA